MGSEIGYDWAVRTKDLGASSSRPAEEGDGRRVINLVGTPSVPETMAVSFLVSVTDDIQCYPWDDGCGLIVPDPVRRSFARIGSLTTLTSHFTFSLAHG